MAIGTVLGGTAHSLVRGMAITDDGLLLFDAFLE